MSTIPGSLGLTVVGVVLGLCAAGPRRDMWRATLGAVTGSTIGFAGMWASKWVFAAPVLGVGDVIDNVRNQIEFRLSGDDAGVSPNRTRGLTANLAEWWGQPLTPWVIAAVAVGALVAGLRSRGRGGSAPPWAAIATSCAIIAVPVAGWYLVSNNHSQIHSWLVYRSIPITFGGLLAVIGATTTESGNATPGQVTAPVATSA